MPGSIAEINLNSPDSLGLGVIGENIFGGGGFFDNIFNPGQTQSLANINANAQIEIANSQFAAQLSQASMEAEAQKGMMIACISFAAIVVAVSLIIAFRKKS
jgi:hypothetical protein